MCLLLLLYSYLALFGRSVLTALSGFLMLLEYSSLLLVLLLEVALVFSPPSSTPVTLRSSVGHWQDLQTPQGGAAKEMSSGRASSC